MPATETTDISLRVAPNFNANFDWTPGDGATLTIKSATGESLTLNEADVSLLQERMGSFKSEMRVYEWSRRALFANLEDRGLQSNISVENPSAYAVAQARWISPTQDQEAFGAPFLSFRNNVWELKLSGLPETLILSEAQWNDIASIEAITERLHSGAEPLLTEAALLWPDEVHRYHTSHIRRLAIQRAAGALKPRKVVMAQAIRALKERHLSTSGSRQSRMVIAPLGGSPSPDKPHMPFTLQVMYPRWSWNQDARVRESEKAREALAGIGYRLIHSKHDNGNTLLEADYFTRATEAEVEEHKIAFEAQFAYALDRTAPRSAVI